jgi:hypothetical protein
LHQIESKREKMISGDLSKFRFAYWAEIKVLILKRLKLGLLIYSEMKASEMRKINISIFLYENLRYHYSLTLSDGITPSSCIF